MDDRFADDIVMVTGASGLVGAGIAAAFLDEGARVVAMGNKNPLTAGTSYAKLDPETFDNERVLWLKKDLKKDEDIESAFAETEEHWGPVSVLVNNAAVYGGRTPFEDVDRTNLQHIMDVNLFAVLLCGRRAALAMIENKIRGRIVNMTSTSSMQSEGWWGYEASKGAVNSATRGMAVSLAPYGIRVNAVGPGQMVKAQETDNLHDEDMLMPFERARIPLGHVATPQECADATLFLCSEASRGITGTILWVEGGTLGSWCTMPENIALHSAPREKVDLPLNK